MGFLAEFYDVVHESRSRRDLNFFLDYSKRAKGRTLELGCGTGRVLIPTAIAGCGITGLDLSPYMLKKCQDKLDRQSKKVQERVRLIQGNMTNFENGELYQLVIIPFNTFQQLISVEEQKACLHCIINHLLPRGLLVLDIFHPFPPRLVPDPKYTTEIECLPETRLPDGRILRCTSRTANFHRGEQYNDIELIYYVSHPDGKMERLVQAFPMRYFFRYEVEHLLNLCGFRVIELFGDYDRSKFSNDSPQMIFVAEKEG